MYSKKTLLEKIFIIKMNLSYYSIQSTIIRKKISSEDIRGSLKLMQAIDKIISKGVQFIIICHETSFIFPIKWNGLCNDDDKNSLFLNQKISYF